jgi:hypothetical protein
MSVDARLREIQEILRDWRDSRSGLYASLFQANRVRACAGLVVSVDDEAAVIADTTDELHLPYASASDCTVVTLDQRTRSLTLTWRDGASAFLVTRSLAADEQS